MTRIAAAVIVMAAITACGERDTDQLVGSPAHAPSAPPKQTSVASTLPKVDAETLPSAVVVAVPPVATSDPKASQTTEPAPAPAPGFVLSHEGFWPVRINDSFEYGGLPPGLSIDVFRAGNGGMVTVITEVFAQEASGIEQISNPDDLNAQALVVTPSRLYTVTLSNVPAVERRVG